MSYFNCAWCPAASFLYGHHGYDDVVFEEYRCVSGHKTFVQREAFDGDRIYEKPGEATGHCC